MNVLPLIIIMTSVLAVLGIGRLFGGRDFLTFLQESDHAYSWGRVTGTATVVTAIWGFGHVVAHTHAIPDVGTLMGLASFGGFPFALSKGIAAAARPSANL
jgi:hypothetical protein